MVSEESRGRVPVPKHPPDIVRRNATAGWDYKAGVQANRSFWSLLTPSNSFLGDSHQVRGLWALQKEKKY